MDVILITMLIPVFALVTGLSYVATTIGFHLFSIIFCTLDDYLQDRYWAKRGYTKDVGEDGQTWYVSNLD